jgi:2-polyprenyl-6-methoxyphenol hydroxylase-like FAD-dependent oxidoreductase
VVVGAGIGGLCAARVLADFFERVTVIDRDTLPSDGEARAGVPQGRHLHALLTGGARAIGDDLFPGLVDDLVAAGAPTGDILADGRCYFDRCRLAQTPSGLPGIGVSRPYLEYRVRRRLADQPNVSILSAQAVDGLVASADGAAVSGVRVGPSTPTGPRAVINADLVVDTSGRRSQTPRWLAELGYPQPVEERIRIDVAYASCVATLPDPALNGDSGIVIGATIDTPCGGAIIGVENGQWLVSLAGYRGAHPPVMPDEFVAFARTLPTPDIYEALRAATSLSKPVRYHIPDAVRRRYERLPRFPDGLVVLGDAVCSFNPVYGQGMSVAAAEALILRDCLRQGSAGLRRIRGKIARAGAVAWSMSVSSDLRMPWIDGPRTPLVRLGNAYAAWLYRAARHDPAVARAFMRVANLVEPPARLARPSIALRVLARGRRRPTATVHRTHDPPGRGESAPAPDHGREAGRAP